MTLFSRLLRSPIQPREQLHLLHWRQVFHSHQLTPGSSLILHPFTDPIAQSNLSKQLHPTVIVANSSLTSLLVQEVMGWRRESTTQSIKLTWYMNKLSNGRLPVGLQEVRQTISTNLRLMYISVQPETNGLNSYYLEMLRAGLGSHLIYALGTPMAFGPIAQTHLHDYRTDSPKDSGLGHFGAPTAGVEIKLTGISDEGSVHGKVGAVEVNGPIVVGKGWVPTGLKAKWRRDGCLEAEF
jgi:hypothetical protein